MINAENTVRSFDPKLEYQTDRPEVRADITATKPIKIIRIIARLNVGGPARQVIWLTKALQNAEYKSVLLAGTVPEGEEDMSYFADENSVTPIYIEAMSRELSPKDLISLWKIFRQLQIEKPDVIHTHTAKAGTVGRVAGFLYRWLGWNEVKIVHTFHGHIFHSYYGSLKTKVFLFIERTLAKLATDKIVVISRQQFHEIHEQFGVGERDQFEIIPLGIDLQEFADRKVKRHLLRDEIGAADDDILIGLVGRLTEVKNHQMFLEVVKIQREKGVLPKLKYLIIGDGNLRESLETKAENLGISDAVIFLGNRKDADVFYAGLDIIALTSLNEGTPLSIIEAMANEKAVVSTLVGGVTDLLGEVEEQHAGFQVCERGVATASGDAQGFSDGLEYLANNHALREKLGRRGEKFIEESYSGTRLVSDEKELYYSLTKKNRRRHRRRNSSL